MICLLFSASSVCVIMAADLTLLQAIFSFVPRSILGLRSMLVCGVFLACVQQSSSSSPLKHFLLFFAIILWPFLVVSSYVLSSIGFQFLAYDLMFLSKERRAWLWPNSR